MIVAHVGPPLARTGGPAGYLYQLQSAAAAEPSSRHDVRFPAARRATQPVSPRSDLWSVLGRVKRALLGDPEFYRPPQEDLTTRGGNIDRMMRELTDAIRADTAASLDAAADADVVLTHDSFSTEVALERRRPGQRIWMMCHAVTPIGLYAAWSWGVPEADWQSLITLPDVSWWCEKELGIWKQVDGVIIPCAEAAESFQAVDSRFGEVLAGARYLLSGASVLASPGGSADVFSTRQPNHRIGLYLGSPEPYRGFDALVEAVRLLPLDADVGVAVAGPDPGKVPPHPLLRPLGRVEDVAALLASVDFLINVNRFTLFDLSTIEALQAGKPLVLHAVGGNRAFERLGAGAVMIRDIQPETIADGLMHVSTIDRPAFDALARRSRSCWEEHLTPRHMWQRHLALYDELSQ
jgi:glycosyltransferase involved in cell wall biosynthesis